MSEGVYAELRNASNMRFQIEAELTRNKNRIQRWFSIYFPEYKDVYGSFDCISSMMILRQAALPCDIIDLGAERINQIWREAKLKAVGIKRAQTLVEAAKRSIGYTEGLKTARIEIMMLLDEYKTLKSKLDMMMEVIEKLVSRIPFAEKLMEIKGIGIKTVSGFIAEVGDISRFTDAKQIQKLAGQAIIENSSGKHKGQSRIRKRGRKRLRYLLFEAVLSLTATNHEFKEIHRYYITRQNNPLKKKQSLIVLSNKLIRVFYAILKNGADYDPERSFCSECGNKINYVKRFCSECGSAITNNSKFCSGCGAKVNVFDNDIQYSTPHMTTSIDKELSQQTDNEITTFENKTDAKAGLFDIWNNFDVFCKVLIIVIGIILLLLLISVISHNNLALFISIIQMIGVISSLLIHKNIIKINKNGWDYLLLIIVGLFGILNIMSYSNKESESTTTNKTAQTTMIISQYTETTLIEENKLATVATTTATATTNINKPPKNGFNKNTNNSVTVGNYCFSIPNYWKVNDDEPELYRAFAETSGKVAMLQIISNHDDLDTVSYELLKEENDNGLMADAFKSWNDSCGEVTSQEYNNGIIKGFLYTWDFIQEGIDGKAQCLVFPSEESNSWMFVSLAETNNTENTYFDDYSKIFDTIEIKSDMQPIATSNTTVTSQSTIPETSSKYEKAFVKKCQQYDIYYMFDSDNQTVIQFYTEDAFVLNGTYSGDFKTGVLIDITSYGDGWYETFINKSGSYATLIDYNGFEFDYEQCDVSIAHKALENLN
ncbi:MAG: transposase [Ruminococcus sp.]|nr:transposase [Ruminococcus sp.]